MRACVCLFVRNDDALRTCLFCFSETKRKLQTKDLGRECTSGGESACINRQITKLNCNAATATITQNKAKQSEIN